MQNLFFGCWYHLDLFAVQPSEQRCFHDQATPPCQEFETRCMLRVPTPPMFAYFSYAFENDGQPLSHFICETANPEFTVMSDICFIWAAEFGVSDLCIRIGSMR